MERQNTQEATVNVDNNKATAKDIRDWMVNYLSQLLKIPPQEIKIKVPFDRYGLDSSAVVVMSGDLEEWLQIDLDPTLVYDYPTIESLAQYLAEEL